MTIAHGSGRRRSFETFEERVLVGVLIRGSGRGLRRLDGLDGVAAELVPQRRLHLRGEVDLPARGEAGEERRADRRDGHVRVDRLVDRPAALAGVLDVARDVVEVVAVLLERRVQRARAATSGRPSRSARCRRSRCRSRSNSRLATSARSPRRRPASARTRSRCAPSSRSGPRRSRRRAPSRPRARAPRRSASRRLTGALSPPTIRQKPTSRPQTPPETPTSTKRDLLLPRLLVAALRVAEVRVAAVDDRVAGLEDAEELAERVLGDLAGRHHHPDVRAAARAASASSPSVFAVDSTFGS